MGKKPLDEIFWGLIICLDSWVMLEPKMQGSSSSALMQNQPSLLAGDWTLE